MTVRNVRNHRSRGLLRRRCSMARTGYYGERAPRAAEADPRHAGRGLQPRGDPAACSAAPQPTPAVAARGARATAAASRAAAARHAAVAVRAVAELFDRALARVTLPDPHARLRTLRESLAMAARPRGGAARRAAARRGRPAARTSTRTSPISRRAARRRAARRARRSAGSRRSTATTRRCARTTRCGPTRRCAPTRAGRRAAASPPRSPRVWAAPPQRASTARISSVAASASSPMRVRLARLDGLEHQLVEPADDRGGERGGERA